jgi:hypothetical protein
VGTTPNEPLDPREGEMANEEVSAARRDIEGQLADGSLGLADLFEMNESEPRGESHRIVGHMHLRAALLSLDGIGEVKADEILDEVGLEGDQHIDTLDSDDQARLVEAVGARQPSA